MSALILDTSATPSDTQTPPPKSWAAPHATGTSSLLVILAIVFVSNAGLLVLQLVAGRLLAPFIGSSLETWTTVIGVFLAGIAAGNWVGASLPATRGRLFGVLFASSLASLWMVGFAEFLHRSTWHTALGLGSRIIVLSAILCFPVGFLLSLLTPLAVKIGTADIRRGGRVTGLTFALGTLGCLLGNYLTGFWLIPSFTINAIVLVVAKVLFLLSAVTWFFRVGVEHESHRATAPRAMPHLMKAYCTVFACSFAGMSLELAGVRIMAQIVGVSLFTWTGVIGVMLAGTAVGNWLGGNLADRPGDARFRLATCLVLAGVAASLVLALIVGTGGHWFQTWPIVSRVVAWSFVLFFLPMMLLGTISPQVIRQFTPSAELAGAVAGRVYAVSTLGAIAGTFATGFVLISELGMLRVVLLAALLPTVASLLIAKIWERRVVLYPAMLVVGAVVIGFLQFSAGKSQFTRESNYFAIQVKPAQEESLAKLGVLTLQLDLLVHSCVKPDDPTFIYYPHEQIQLALLRDIATRQARPNVLVVGGGAYTFPRAAKTYFPNSVMDVVEIDPAVTEVTYDKLFLDPKLGINSFHMDGRQFVAERTKPGTYDLVTLDAVNDYSVPSHLLTKEFNDRVKVALAPGGVYLVTVIDQPDIGKIWKAALHTLRQSFAHVELLAPTPTWEPNKQAVYIVYASDEPLDWDRVRSVTERALGPNTTAGHRPPAGVIENMLAADPPVLLRDQYSPVDWLMADVFQRRQSQKANGGK